MLPRNDNPSYNPYNDCGSYSNCSNYDEVATACAGAVTAARRVVISLR
jgi:hypothetical protein